VPPEPQLSPTSRRLVGLTAVVFGLLGALLFLVPGWAADHFPWKVTPFVAMTMGGWYLGSAFTAAYCFARPRWAEVYGCLAYLGAFALFEAGLLVLYHGVLRPEAALAWPYGITLGVASLTALAVALEAVRARPALPDRGPVPGWVRLELLGLLGLTWTLAFFGPDSFGADASVFPQPLTPLTVRAFAAFYFSLGLAAAMLLRTRDLAPVVAIVVTGYSLIVAITAAALVNLGEFDFAARPGGLLYFGAYVAAAIGAGFILAYARRQDRAAA